MPFVILNAISTRVATWKSALTALYSHRPQPTFFNPHFYGIETLSTVSNKWTSRTYLSSSNKDTRCDRIALTTRFKLSPHIQYQPASQPYLLLLAKRPKRRGKKGEETRLLLEAHTINAIRWIYVHCFYSQTKDTCEQIKSIQKRNFRYFLVLTRVSDVENVQQLI